MDGWLNGLRQTNSSFTTDCLKLLPNVVATSSECTFKSTATAGTLGTSQSQLLANSKACPIQTSKSIREETIECQPFTQAEALLCS